MNKEHTLVNNTSKSVVGLFEKSLNLWSGNVAVEESINKLKAYVSGVDAAAYEQVNKSTVGITVDKKQQRKLVIVLTLGLIAKIRPYAKRAGNNELLQAVDFSESDLSQVREDLCMSRCMVVANKGREFLTKMEAYKVTNNDIVAIETAVEPFVDIAEKRDITEGERKSATEKIDMLIPLMRQELKILDDLVKSQMPEDFQSTYFNLR